MPTDCLLHSHPTPNPLGLQQPCGETQAGEDGINHPAACCHVGSKLQLQPGTAASPELSAVTSTG